MVRTVGFVTGTISQHLSRLSPCFAPEALLVALEITSLFSFQHSDVRKRSRIKRIKEEELNEIFTSTSSMCIGASIYVCLEKWAIHIRGSVRTK